MDAKRKTVLLENKKRFIQLNPWYDWSKICIVKKFKDEKIDGSPIIPKIYCYRSNSAELDLDINSAISQSPNGIVIKKNYGSDVWVFPKCTVADVIAGLGSTDTGYLIEEYLVSKDPIPINYKVFYFDGVPRTCTVVNKNFEDGEHIVCYSLSDDCFIDQSEYKTNLAHLAPNSQMLEPIWKAVKRSKRIFNRYLHPQTTCSMDMYVLSDRVLLGNISPSPGLFTSNVLSDRFTKILLN